MKKVNVLKFDQLRVWRINCNKEVNSETRRIYIIEILEVYFKNI